MILVAMEKNLSSFGKQKFILIVQSYYFQSILTSKKCISLGAFLFIFSFTLLQTLFSCQAKLSLCSKNPSLLRSRLCHNLGTIWPNSILSFPNILSVLLSGLIAFYCYLLYWCSSILSERAEIIFQSWILNSPSLQKLYKVRGRHFESHKKNYGLYKDETTRVGEKMILLYHLQKNGLTLPERDYDFTRT